MVHVPILVRPREIEDDELRQMLLSAYASGNTITFFDHFAYQGHPQQTLEYGEALLRKCRSLAPDAYKILHKGTPFYWLAQAAFLVHDYETAAFYIDAAVSEDLRVDPTNMTTPALLFFLIDDANERQASLELVKLLRSRIEKSIKKYEDRTGSVRVPPTFDEIRKIFLRPAAAPANAHLRTLATTFISFFLEWDHRCSLFEMRTEQGTAEPFFIHLFKGCVLFESLLKANVKHPPKEKMLGRVLNELTPELGLGAGPLATSVMDFQTIVNELPSDDGSVHAAIVRTGRIRNTTGHNLGWQTSLDVAAYDVLAESVATSCLHALSCLYG